MIFLSCCVIFLFIEQHRLRNRIYRMDVALRFLLGHAFKDAEVTLREMELYEIGKEKKPAKEDLN